MLWFHLHFFVKHTTTFTFIMSDDSSFASDDTIDREMYGECPGELKPGDVIMYFSPVFVFGNKEGLRVAQVLCTEPKTESPLVLSSTG